MKKILLIAFLLSFGLLVEANSEEKMTYLSKNIIGFENMFGNKISDQPDQEVFGYLRFPDDTNATNKYPLIIASHGSSNWRDHHMKYLEQMRQAGYAVFAMHLFDSRDISSTVGNQTNLTLETAVYDMAMTLKLLWNDPRIDNRKIYAAGWSLGGSTALFNAWIPWQQEIFKNKETFSGYLMWYPGCFSLPDDDNWDKKYMHIFMGGSDNWTPPKPCVDLVNRLNKNGGDANISLYPGAYHSFDGPVPLALWPDAYSFENCNFPIDSNTKKVYLPDDKSQTFDFTNPASRTAAYLTCASKGNVLAGYSPEYRNAAYEDLVSILKKLK